MWLKGIVKLDPWQFSVLKLIKTYLGSYVCFCVCVCLCVHSLQFVGCDSFCGKLPLTSAISAAEHCCLLHCSGPAPTRHECQIYPKVNFVFSWLWCTLPFSICLLRLQIEKLVSFSLSQSVFSGIFWREAITEPCQCRSCWKCRSHSSCGQSGPFWALVWSELT